AAQTANKQAAQAAKTVSDALNQANTASQATAKALADAQKAANEAQIANNEAQTAAKTVENALAKMKVEAAAEDNRRNTIYTPTKNKDNNGIKDFLNGKDIAKLDKHDKASYNEYKVSYNMTKKGFFDAINNRNRNNPEHWSYTIGYNAGNDYARGVYDASHGLKQRKNDSPYYNSGYNGTVAGLAGKHHKGAIDFKMGYNMTYKQARNKFPMYVSSLKGIYIHNDRNFSEDTRVRLLRKKNRIKVIGISYTKSGKLRYITKYGYITGNKKFVKVAQNKVKNPK
ncbi:DUF5776 domain-containing protein, partial [Apilactobacillus sp. M161]